MQPDDFQNIFVRYLNNNCSKAETEFLLEQLSAGALNPEQQQLLEEHITNWNALQANSDTIDSILQTKLNDIKKRIDQEVQQTEVPKKATLSWRSYAAAAAIASVLATGYFLYNRTSAMGTETFAVQAGEKRSLRLPDGSQVILNGGSSLILSDAFTTGNREVTLTGEAYFDVAQNASHPFVIHTASMDIKVLGTAFNVRSYPDEAMDETSLIRGKVQITLKKPGSQAPDYVLLPMQKLVVTKNSKAGADYTVAVNKPPHIDSLQKNRQINNLAETAWTENKLAFDNETLETVADKMEKWYGITVEFRNETLKTIPYTGSFDGETLEKVIETIQYSIPMLQYKMGDSRKLILF